MYLPPYIANLSLGYTCNDLDMTIRSSLMIKTPKTIGANTSQVDLELIYIAKSTNRSDVIRNVTIHCSYNRVCMDSFSYSYTSLVSNRVKEIDVIARAYDPVSGLYSSWYNASTSLKCKPELVTLNLTALSIVPTPSYNDTDLRCIARLPHMACMAPLFNYYDYYIELVWYKNNISITNYTISLLDEHRCYNSSCYSDYLNSSSFDVGDLIICAARLCNSSLCGGWSYANTTIISSKRCLDLSSLLSEPSDSIVITSPTVLCPGTYILDHRIIMINNASLDCDGSTLITHSDVGIIVSGLNNSYIRNCKIKYRQKAIEIINSSNISIYSNTLSALTSSSILSAMATEMATRRLSTPSTPYYNKSWNESLPPVSKISGKAIFVYSDRASQISEGYGGKDNSIINTLGGAHNIIKGLIVAIHSSINNLLSPAYLSYEAEKSGEGLKDSILSLGKSYELEHKNLISSEPPGVPLPPSVPDQELVNRGELSESLLSLPFSSCHYDCDKDGVCNDKCQFKNNCYVDPDCTSGRTISIEIRDSTRINIFSNEFKGSDYGIDVYDSLGTEIHGNVFQSDQGFYISSNTYLNASMNVLLGDCRLFDYKILGEVDYVPWLERIGGEPKYVCSYGGCLDLYSLSIQGYPVYLSSRDYGNEIKLCPSTYNLEVLGHDNPAIVIDGSLRLDCQGSMLLGGDDGIAILLTGSDASGGSTSVELVNCNIGHYHIGVKSDSVVSRLIIKNSSLVSNDIGLDLSGPLMFDIYDSVVSDSLYSGIIIGSLLEHNIHDNYFANTINFNITSAVQPVDLSLNRWGVHCSYINTTLVSSNPMHYVYLPYLDETGKVISDCEALPELLPISASCCLDLSSYSDDLMSSRHYPVEIKLTDVRGGNPRLYMLCINSSTGEPYYEWQELVSNITLHICPGIYRLGSSRGKGSILFISSIKNFSLDVGGPCILNSSSPFYSSVCGRNRAIISPNYSRHRDFITIHNSSFIGIRGLELSGFDRAINIDNASSMLVISNNIFNDNNYGIVSSSSNLTVSHNIFSKDIFGIVLRGSEYSRIEDNLFTNRTGHGILLDNSYSIFILNNTFINLTHYSIYNVRPAEVREYRAYEFVPMISYGPVFNVSPSLGYVSLIPSSEFSSMLTVPTYLVCKARAYDNFSDELILTYHWYKDGTLLRIVNKSCVSGLECIDKLYNLTCGSNYSCAVWAF
ncbi:MAG: hypothetical protein DRH12_16545, partial [Deltaproteobacteria bacterium]